MGLISRPDTWLSSWHPPSLSSAGLLIPRSILSESKLPSTLSQIGSLTYVYNSTVVPIQNIEEIVPLVSSIDVLKSILFSFQFPCRWPIWLFSKLLEHFPPRYKHGWLFSLIIQFSVDLLRVLSCSVNQRSSHVSLPSYQVLFSSKYLLLPDIFLFYSFLYCLFLLTISSKRICLLLNPSA